MLKVVDGPNEPSLKLKINIDLTNLTRWLSAYKLTIHPTKSNILIIPPKINQATPTVELHVNNSLIPQHAITRYVGVTSSIDENLKFDHHIVRSIEHKISKSGIISKLRYFMPQKALLHIYFVLVHPHFLYGLPVRGSTYPSCMKILITLRNKVVKMVSADNTQDSHTQFYSELKMLKLTDLCKPEIGKIVHAQQQNKLPLKFSYYCIESSNTSQRITRNVWKAIAKYFIILNIAPLVCRNASNTSKELKCGTKFPRKFKIHRSKCLKKIQRLHWSTVKFKQKCLSTFLIEFFPLIPNLQPVFVHHVRFKRYFKFFHRV